MVFGAGLRCGRERAASGFQEGLLVVASAIYTRSQENRQRATCKMDDGAAYASSPSPTRAARVGEGDEA